MRKILPSKADDNRALHDHVDDIDDEVAKILIM
jgi:hypothetical protein